MNDWRDEWKQWCLNLWMERREAARPLMVRSILPQSQATPPGIVLQDGVVTRAQRAAVDRKNRGQQLQQVIWVGPQDQRGWISLEGPSLNSHGHRSPLCTWHCINFCYKDFFNSKELLLELMEEKREERPLVWFFFQPLFAAWRVSEPQMRSILHLVDMRRKPETWRLSEHLWTARCFLPQGTSHVCFSASFRNAH